MYKADSRLIDRTENTQPALFALEYALTELWRSYGIEPHAVMGHSVGEYVAACVAGVFSLEDGLKLIFERGRLMQKLPGQGEMGAIAASEDAVRKIIEKDFAEISMAAVNGPESVVISGESSILRKALSRFENDGVKVKLLNVSHAFHSSQMDPMADEFEKIAATIAFSKPNLKLISNRDGQVVEDDRICKARYWTAHARDPVRFMDGMLALGKEKIDLYLEVGPGTTLLGVGKECLGVEEVERIEWFPSMKKDVSEWSILAESVCGLYASGADIDWRGWEQGFPRRKRITLPTYAFQKKRYWVEGVRSKGLPTRGLLGIQIDSARNSDEHTFEIQIGAESPAYMKDHQVYGTPIVPAAAYVEMVLSALSRLEGVDFAKSHISVRDLEIKKAMILEESTTRKVQLVLVQEAEQSYRFQIFSRGPVAGGWQEHVSGVVSAMKGQVRQADKMETLQARRHGSTETGAAVYEHFARMGLNFGESFRGVTNVWRGDLESLIEVELPEELSGDFKDYLFHPAQLDACFQSVLCGLKSESGRALLPVGFDEIRYFDRPTKKLWVYAKTTVETIGDKKVLHGDLRVMNEFGGWVAEIRGINAVESSADAVLAGKKANIDDWYYETVWEDKAVEPVAVTGRRSAGSWLIFADRGGVGERLAKEVAALGDRTILVGWDDSLKDVKRNGNGYLSINPTVPDHYVKLLQEIDQQQTLQQVVHFWSLDCDDVEVAKTLESDQWRSYGSGLSAVQALLNSKQVGSSRLSFITRGAQPAGSGADPIHVEQSSLWGLGKVVGLEHPELHCICVDFDGDKESSVVESQVQHLLMELEGRRAERQVAFRKRPGRPIGRLVARLTKVGQLDVTKAALSADKTYLITGGMGGLGLQIAKRMVEAEGIRHLALLGRTAPGDRALKVVGELEKRGATVRIYEGDVAIYKDVERVISQIRREMPELAGVIHSAGVLDDATIPNQDWEKYLKVMAPKINGTWNLHQATKMLKLDHFILFSSIASLMGNSGQCNYAAANAWMDGFARYRRQKGMSGISVNWGGWKEVGLATNLLQKGLLEERGLGGMTNEEGVEAFSRLLRSSKSTVAVSPINWIKFLQDDGVKDQPFFSRFHQQSKAKKENSAPINLLPQIEAADESGRRQILESFLRTELTKILGLGEGGAVEAAANFRTLGMDSLMAVTLRNRLKKALGEKLAKSISGTIVLKFPSLDALVGHLVKDVVSMEKLPRANEKSRKTGQ